MKQATKRALQAGGTVASVAMFAVAYLAVRGNDGAASTGGQPAASEQAQPLQFEPVQQQSAPRPPVQTRTRES